jgi:hypothetical protein
MCGDRDRERKPCLLSLYPSAYSEEIPCGLLHLLCWVRYGRTNEMQGRTGWLEFVGEEEEEASKDTEVFVRASGRMIDVPVILINRLSKLMQFRRTTWFGIESCDVCACVYHPCEGRTAAKEGRGRDFLCSRDIDDLNVRHDIASTWLMRKIGKCDLKWQWSPGWIVRIEVMGSGPLYRS